jgi:GT2 family glycosyltransferase
MSRHTLIIVNWNSWDILSRCLENLENQAFRDFDVLVIDNASDRPVPDGLLSRYPNVTLIQNQSNIGYAAANNQAIMSLGETEWVGLLNPDAFPEPDWLQRLIDAADENPDYSMFASRQLVDKNPHVLDGDGDVYHISGKVWREGRGRHKEGAADELREIFSPCGAAALFRRDALVSVGGFDEDFFCYVEDVDLGFRLRLMGHRCLLVPGAVVHHIGSATTGGQHSDFSVYHGHRNLVWTFVKDMPGILFWLCLPYHLALNAAALVLYSARGRWRVILGSKLDAIKGLPKMWRKRREIQARRVISVRDVWNMLDKGLPWRRP